MQSVALRTVGVLGGGNLEQFRMLRSAGEAEHIPGKGAVLARVPEVSEATGAEDGVVLAHAGIAPTFCRFLVDNW